MSPRGAKISSIRLIKWESPSVPKAKVRYIQNKVNKSTSIHRDIPYLFTIQYAHMHMHMLATVLCNPPPSCLITPHPAPRTLHYSINCLIHAVNPCIAQTPTILS